MDCHVSRVDLRATAENWPKDIPFRPALLLKQPTVTPQDWWIADAPLEVGFQPSWASAKNDQYVRIPLFQYQLSNQADLALAHLLELGLSCAGHLPGPVKKFHVAVGSPVDLIYEPDTNTNVGIRYWFGIAVVIDKGV